MVDHTPKYKLPELSHGRRWHIYEKGNLIYVALQIKKRFGWRTVFEKYTNSDNGLRGVDLKVNEILAKVEAADLKVKRAEDIPFGKHYGKKEDEA